MLPGSGDEDDYKNSPGRARQQERYRWTWDFEETNVRAGHDCVSSGERDKCKSKGAKLTFGEVLDSGVGHMLHNLGAAHKKKFHDLGMGPGKMLFQTYLSFPNMITCMGVELAFGRYKLAEKNMMSLLKHGWRGRTFQLIEFGKDAFMTIVERLRHQHPRDGFKVGDSVLAYKLKIREKKEQIIDYTGKITNIEEDGRITVKYDKIKDTEVTLDPKFVFLPGSARTCEIWFGSLFDYPGNWDAEMCILETDFPPDMHAKLIDGMCKTPIGCTFLTYHDLKKFQCYRHTEIRQIDCNVYDSDRYLTSWSQGWRFYIWEHTNDPKSPLPCPPDVTPEMLAAEEKLRVFMPSELEWKWGKPVEALKDAVVVTVGGKKQTIKLKSGNVALHRSRVKQGQRVSTFNPDWVPEKNYQLFPGTVKRLLPCGGILVNWEGINEVATIRPQHCFQPPDHRYRKGQKVYSCWTAYAVNKNSPERYRKFEAEVLTAKSDGTYEVSFEFGESSGNVREMWITTKEEDKRIAILSRKQASDPQLSCSIQVANKWTPLCISTTLVEASADSGLKEADREDFTKACNIVMEKGITGKEFLAMKAVDLVEELGMTAAAAKLFMSRYMAWITSRVDRPAGKGKRKRKGKSGSSSNKSTPVKNGGPMPGSATKKLQQQPGGGVTSVADPPDCKSEE